MKIKIISSIRGKSDKRAYIIKQIALFLEQRNHTVFYKHLTDFDQKNLDAFTEAEHYQFHKQILQNIKAADVVIAECSHQSLSVGYLISFAIELGKPTIIFYENSAPKPNLFPSLVKENDIYLVPYASGENITELVGEYIEYAMEDTDVRFNLMLSSDMYNYLNQVAKKENLPKSVIVRRLIEQSKD